MYANNDAAAAAGINNDTSVSVDKVMKALVADYNARGGFGGRRIEPFFRHLNSSSNDFEGDLAASCAAFTQDDHVAIVVHVVGLFSESFQSCLSKAHIPVINDLAPDQVDAKKFPLLVTVNDLLADTRIAHVVSLLDASGWLGSRNRIGVIVEDCPVGNRVYSNTLQPALAAAHLTLASTVRVQCFQRIGDLGTISGQMGNAVVNFRANRVDRVMFVSLGQEGTLSFEFMLAAGQQNWYPGYAMSSMSYATTLATQSGVKEQEVANSRGIGWNPVTDTADLSQAPPNGIARDCLVRTARRGIRPASNNDKYFVWSTCDQFALLDHILVASRGDSSPVGFLRGLAVVGNGFVSAVNVAGSATTWDRGRLGPGAYRYFGWDPRRQAFAYTSNATAFPRR